MVKTNVSDLHENYLDFCLQQPQIAEVLEKEAGLQKKILDKDVFLLELREGKTKVPGVLSKKNFATAFASKSEAKGVYRVRSQTRMLRGVGLKKYKGFVFQGGFVSAVEQKNILVFADT